MDKTPENTNTRPMVVITQDPTLVGPDVLSTSVLERKSLDDAERAMLGGHPVRSKDYIQSFAPRSPQRDSHFLNMSPATDAAHALPQSGHRDPDCISTLSALSIGAPLIASVVVSCISAMRDEMSAAFGEVARSRPFSAQVTFALMWAATVISLGSTIISVAGLSMAAGYYDSHIGITKTVIRKIRVFRRRMARSSPSPEGGALPTRAPSLAGTVATISKQENHAKAALRAAEVSARLLGISIISLASGLAVYVFTVHGWRFGLFVLIIGLLTAATYAIPWLLIIVSSTKGPHAGA